MIGVVDAMGRSKDDLLVIGSEELHHCVTIRVHVIIRGLIESVHVAKGFAWRKQKISSGVRVKEEVTMILLGGIVAMPIVQLFASPAHPTPLEQGPTGMTAQIRRCTTDESTDGRVDAIAILGPGAGGIERVGRDVQ